MASGPRRSRPAGPTCPRCQRQNRRGARFCDSCGASLGTPGAQGALPAARFAAPEHYTPAHLAAKIRGAKSHLEGERKHITVLFADTKGSTELLAGRDPEEARKLLDPVLERMMEAVHRYEGTVNQVMGDGIMALFGAPVAHEDHAVRACFAALRMQETVKRYAEAAQRAAGAPIHVRVGLNSGEVVVRSIGSDLRMDYTAVGQTTHLAARMEQMATPGSTFMTADTLDLAEGYVQVRALGPVPVKGLSAPVEVFELTGAGPARTRLHAAAAHGLTRFVGRESELEQLRQALERARAGHGQVVAVVGEPGVGKSRLFREFVHSALTRDCLVLEASSVSYGKATPYGPVIDLLKRYFDIVNRDDRAAMADKVRRQLVGLDPALASDLPAFFGLLDLPVDSEPWGRLTPRQRRRRTLEALRRLFLRESQAQPLLLVFEDLQWIDSESQALLDSLRASLRTARILLLASYRTDYELPGPGQAAFTQLRIGALTEQTAEELLDTLLAPDPSLIPLKRLLIERTAGNPLFLEETVRSLAETGALSGPPGLYRLAQPVREVQVPSTVQAILAARLDRLPPDEKRLLQSASVIGKDVPLAILEAVCGLPEPVLRRGLTHLQSAEFLHEETLFPEVEYTFKHALTHQVAYQELLKEHRRLLHARIAEAIERLFPDRLAEQVDKLALHTYRGEAWGRAVAYCREAGDKAASRCAYREAVTSFEQAVEALQRLPEDRETLEQAADLQFRLRIALLPLGEFEGVLDHLHEAEALCSSLGDPRRLGQVYNFMAQSFSWVGDHERGIESGLRARGIGVALGDVGLRVVGRFRVGQLYLTMGEYRRGAAVLGRAVEEIRGEMLRERFGLSGLPSVLCRTMLVWCLAELGHFAEALRHAEENIRIAEAVNHAFDRINAYFGLGLVCVRQGDLDRAIPLLEPAVRLCDDAELPALVPATAIALGLAYAHAGRLDEGLSLLDRSVRQHEALKILGSRSFLVGAQGEGYLLAGRLEEAGRLCEEALSLAGQYGERGYEAWARKLLGDLAGRHDPPRVDEAESAYRRTLRLAGDLGMRPLRARCHLALGQLLHRAGRVDEASEHLTISNVLLHDMGLRPWPGQPS